MRCVFTFLFYFLFAVDDSMPYYNTMQIKDLKLSKCDNKNYPVTVDNVTIHLGTQPRVKVSGTLSTQVDLVGPVKAEVLLKRDIWGIWVEVPCEDKIGSCTYDNLCDYGIPQNTTCPQIYQQNKVPCRCPIKKGNYTILPSVDISQATSILSGTYKGTVTITQNNQFLSCYNLNFVLYDENDFNSVFQI